MAANCETADFRNSQHDSAREKAGTVARQKRIGWRRILSLKKPNVRLWKVAGGGSRMIRNWHVQANLPSNALYVRMCSRRVLGVWSPIRRKVYLQPRGTVPARLGTGSRLVTGNPL